MQIALQTEKGKALTRLTNLMAVVVLTSGAASAAARYIADFSSYSAGNTITANSTGDNDTATSLPSAATLTGTTTAFDGSSDGMTNGLSLKIGASAFTSEGSVSYIQYKLGKYGNGSALVVSFDVYSRNEEIRAAFQATNNARIGSNFISPTAMTNKLTRVTLVMNATGSNIALPGTLGSLASGNNAAYYKLNGGSTYSLIGTQANGVDAGGFVLSSSLNALNNYVLIDNVGVWDSVSDTVGGTSVLELPFGTPATMNALEMSGYINAANHSTLQAAVDALPACGGTVFLPPGTYTLDMPLDLTDAYGSKKVTLAGSGKYNTVITGNFPDSVIIDATGASGLTVRDLQITGMAQCLWLSAHSPSSAAGSNYFENVRFNGDNCEIALALLGSEQNCLINCMVQAMQPDAVCLLFSPENHYNLYSPYSTVCETSTVKGLELYGVLIHSQGTNSVGMLIEGGASGVHSYGGYNYSAGLASIYLDGTEGPVRDVSIQGLRIESADGNHSLYAKGAVANVILSCGAWGAGGEPVRYESINGSTAENWAIRDIGLSIKENSAYHPGLAGGHAFMRMDSVTAGTFKNINCTAYDPNGVRSYTNIVFYSTDLIKGCDITLQTAGQMVIAGNDIGNRIQVLYDNGATRRIYSSGDESDGPTVVNLAPTLAGNVNNVQPGDFIMLKDGNGTGIPCPAYYDGIGWKKLIGQ